MEEGLALTTPTTFDDLELPFLPFKNIIGDGTLVSIDMATSLGLTLPVSGSILPNQAWEQAKAMLAGVGDLNSLSPTLTYQNNARSLVERTGKGGLSGLVSAVALTSGDGWLVKFPDPIEQYLLSNKAHNFYASYWAKILRAGSSNGGDYMALRTSGSTDRFFNMGRGTDLPASAPNRLGAGKTPAAFNVTSGLGDVRRSIGFTGQEGTEMTLTSQLSLGARVGRHDSNFGGSSAGQTCLICYFLYLEDLTVSERSFADVNAMDQAFFTQQVLTAGGKYYGDTFTAASALP